jgi:hypothetical protein
MHNQTQGQNSAEEEHSMAMREATANWKSFRATAGGQDQRMILQAEHR